jgi:hypothetical protein
MPQVGFRKRWAVQLAPRLEARAVLIPAKPQQKSGKSLLRLFLLLVITRGGGKTFNNSCLRAGETRRIGQYFLSVIKICRVLPF